MTDPTGTAEKLRAFGKSKMKPFLASWIGGTAVADGVRILDEANIPTFEYPDAAARAFCAMWRYSRNLDALYETPALQRKQQTSGKQTRTRSSAIAESRAHRLAHGN